MPEHQETGTTSGGPAKSGTEAGGVVANATEAVRNAVSSASAAAENAYGQGSRYVRDAAGHVPDMGQYAELVREPLAQSPIITALAAGAIGYLAAFLIHGGGLGSAQRTHPEHAEHASKRSRRRHRR